MGRPTGFQEYQRHPDGTVKPLKRILNYDEFHTALDPEQRRIQAARCMDCGVPFCQAGCGYGTGTMGGGTPGGGPVSGCPLHNLIPEWNDEIYNGYWQDALSRLLKTNNFPEFTGRVCPALCEAACTCGLNGEPVTVHNNELAIIETGFAQGWMKPEVPAVRSGKRVAVIGSGPSGLAAADQLNHRGHLVTVFEKASLPGGLLMFGIPNMKLDKQVILRRIKLMEQEGIEFRCGIEVGRDITVEALEKSFDAVILCVGSGTPRNLNVPGREGDGVHFAVDYLTAATKKLLKDKGFMEESEPKTKTAEGKGETSDLPASMNACGKHVIVVGGGDTGNDCVATAIRQGCASVVQLEMMTQPPLTRSEAEPWPHWPKILKVDYGQQEAIAVFGEDPRRYCTTVKQILRDEDGKLFGLQTVRLEQKPGMQEVPGSEEEIPCDLLLIAAGFTGCRKETAEAFGAPLDVRGNLITKDHQIDTKDSRQAESGFFAAGDCRRGQSLVVWAIAEGRECARRVDEYLMGYSEM